MRDKMFAATINLGRLALFLQRSARRRAILAMKGFIFMYGRVLFVAILLWGVPLELTSEEQAWLQAHPTIRLAPDPDSRRLHLTIIYDILL